MRSGTKKKKKMVIVWILTALIILISIFLGILFGTNLIQKSLILLMCQDKPSSTPNNYADILNATSLKQVTYYNDLTLDIIETPNLAADAPCVLVFHGGYYVGGGRHNQEPYARLLASYGFRVLNIDYSLAPDAIYPTQLTQANAALNYAAAAYPLSKGFVVSGDSAGAHLAAQLAALVKDVPFRAVRDVGETILPQRLKGFVGNCGFYQASTVSETGFFLIDNALQMLIGQKNYQNSNIIAELDLYNFAASFPDTLLICGDQDPFLSQNIAMRDALEKGGVRVESYFPTSTDNKLGHEFQCNYNFAESYVAMAQIVEFLNMVC